MENELAKGIFEALQSRKDVGKTLTFLEVCCMTKIPSDGCDVYAIQKGDVTVTAWVRDNGVVRTKITSW